MTDTNAPKPKRYSLSADERLKVENVQSVIGIIAMLREGLNHSLILELAKARERLGISASSAPEGFLRSVDFDYTTNELLVTDVPDPKTLEKKEEAKKEAEPTKTVN